jgi:transcriptional regulator with XRE-family HTH domain
MPVPDPQPVKAVLAARRISVRGLARHLGLSPGWVGRVVNGWEPASAEFRQGVARLLDRPEHELFRRRPVERPVERVEQYPGDSRIGQAS